MNDPQTHLHVCSPTLDKNRRLCMPDSGSSYALMGGARSQFPQRGRAAATRNAGPTIWLLSAWVDIFRDTISLMWSANCIFLDSTRALSYVIEGRVGPLRRDETVCPDSPGVTIKKSLSESKYNLSILRLSFACDT